MKYVLLFFAFFAFHQGLFAAIETKQQTARISVAPKTVLIEKRQPGSR